MSEPLNPYASPQEPTAFDPAIAVLPHTRPTRPYQSAAGKAQAALIVVVIEAVLQLLLTGSFVLQIGMLLEGQRGGGIEMAAAQANDARQQILSVLAVCGALAGLITLLIWIYAAYANLPALGNGKLETTPGWAVGYFFIPIVNLWKPFQAVQEINVGSDPGPPVAGPAERTPLVGWWWVLRILSAIVGRVLTSFAGTARDIEDLLNVSYFAIAVTLILDLPLLALQFAMIRRIQRNQERRYAQLSQAPPPALPSLANPWAGMS